MVLTVFAQGFSAASFALDAYNKIDKVVDACGKVKETVSIEGTLLPFERQFDHLTQKKEWLFDKRIECAQHS